MVRSYNDEFLPLWTTWLTNNPVLLESSWSACTKLGAVTLSVDQRRGTASVRVVSKTTDAVRARQQRVRSCRIVALACALLGVLVVP